MKTLNVPSRFPLVVLLSGIFLLAVAMGIGRFSYTAILPSMQLAYPNAGALWGFLASANYFGYMIGALWATFMMTTRKRYRWLMTSIIISILTTCSMGLIDSVFAWIFIRLLSGIASACIMVSLSAIMLDYFIGINKPYWVSWFYGGVGVGIVISALSSAIIHTELSWQWQSHWLFLALISIIIALISLKHIPSTPNHQRSRTASPVKKTKANSKIFLLLSIAYFIEGGGYIITGTFIVAFTESNNHFHSMGYIIWLMVGLSIIPSCYFFARIAGKYGTINILSILYLLQAIGVIIPVFHNSVLINILAAVFFGGTFMSIVTLIVSYCNETSPFNSHTTIGILTFAYSIGQVAAPTAAALAESSMGSMGAALVTCSVALLGSILLLMFAKRLERRIQI